MFIRNLLNNPPLFQRLYNIMRNFIISMEYLDVLMVLTFPSKFQLRSKQGYTSTNAMLVCDDLDHLLFTVAVFGAEGCESDSQVLSSCKNAINWPVNGYLLGDAGYTLSKQLVTRYGYRGVRYQLKEFAGNNSAPQN